MWKVCLHTFRNNRICQKLAYFLKNLPKDLPKTYHKNPASMEVDIHGGHTLRTNDVCKQ